MSDSPNMSKITVYFTNADKKLLTHKAKEAGQNVSQFIRAIVDDWKQKNKE